MAYQVILQLPKDTKVIGVRTRGLWGSMWSRGRDNAQTNLTSLFGYAIIFFIANIIFLIPKRTVTIEIFDISKEIQFKAKE